MRREVYKREEDARDKAEADLCGWLKQFTTVEAAAAAAPEFEKIIIQFSEARNATANLPAILPTASLIKAGWKLKEST